MQKGIVTALGLGNFHTFWLTITNFLIWYDLILTAKQAFYKNGVRNCVDI
jgi:hypothetical protein